MLSDRDRQRLKGVHPFLVQTIDAIFSIMQSVAHPMFVTDGVRTVAQQLALYAQGRTAPGDIVTWADGELKRSNHQAGPDGLGYAVDCAFIDKDPWSERHPWRLYGALAVTLGLTWGGDWPKPKTDRPHVDYRPVDGAR